MWGIFKTTLHQDKPVSRELIQVFFNEVDCGNAERAYDSFNEDSLVTYTSDWIGYVLTK